MTAQACVFGGGFDVTAERKPRSSLGDPDTAKWIEEISADSSRAGSMAVELAAGSVLEGGLLHARDAVSETDYEQEVVQAVT
ncbi:hypothetical protein EYF80_010739 [Liparis tanakae]|uniref:Uncharacterized protein n=1 Tax=Liparis tanakae TaxID=230148 RepID=A0A4Z2ILY8_9TELE|nr:hypothetical protein EYF80_010739 [Liparis tanakae]